MASKTELEQPQQTDQDSAPSLSTSSVLRTEMYLVGINVMHSIAPPMHHLIGRTLFPSRTPSTAFKFTNTECPTLESAMKLFRAADFAGGVVTMPYKQAIIAELDEVDPLVELLGACNNVHLTKNGRLRGSNTDWRGIKGCLISGQERWTAKHGNDQSQTKSKVGMIVGAGGASRAAVYALSVELGCQEIYVVNRDEDEVKSLIASTEAYTNFPGLKQPKITHLTALPPSSLPTPQYIIGTVPDFAPSTPTEIICRDILVTFLDRLDKGVILDMCFKPRNTRTMKLARERDWECVDGTGIIGWQIQEQWRLWVGAGEKRSGVGEVPAEEAWKILMAEAEKSTAINF